MNKKYIEPPQKPHPSVFVTEYKGVLSLHLSSDVNSEISSAPIQGSMRIAVPNHIELEYVKHMMAWVLFKAQPKHIVQLGLGAAALTKFCYLAFFNSKVTAVELNPNVIELCRDQFHLPENDTRLQVLEMDALDFVKQKKRHASIDVLQVDLYDAEAEGPVLNSPEFYQACADCLRNEGILTVNLFANEQQRQQNIQAMQTAFELVICLPEVHEANVIAIAFKTAPQFQFDLLNQRAEFIREQFKLPATIWLDGIKKWMKESGKVNIFT